MIGGGAVAVDQTNVPQIIPKNEFETVVPYSRVTLDVFDRENECAWR